jgi:hypothetical protein
VEEVVFLFARGTAAHRGANQDRYAQHDDGRQRVTAPTREMRQNFMHIQNPHGPKLLTVGTLIRRSGFLNLEWRLHHRKFLPVARGNL